MYEIFDRKFDFVLGEHKFIGSRSRNFWTNKIFGWNFDFVLGEHKLIRSRSKNFSKNFSNSWKWRQIPGIFKILGKTKFWRIVLGEYNWTRGGAWIFVNISQKKNLCKILYTYLKYLPKILTCCCFSCFLIVFFNSFLNSRVTYLSYTYLSCYSNTFFDSTGYVNIPGVSRNLYICKYLVYFS